MRERLSSSTERGDPKVLEVGMIGSFYVTFDGHDTYGTLSAGEKNGVSVRQRPEEAGEVRLAYAPKAPHTASDGSGSYNSGRYH